MSDDDRARRRHEDAGHEPNEPREPADLPREEAPPPEHHGVVETIREEIHEVVEHVPQPVRWTLGKLLRLAALVAIGVIVLGIASAVLYFMNRTELVARELSLLLNRTLRDHSDLVLDLRDIRGNPLTGFRAIEPRIRFRDGATVLEAKEMKVNYSAWSLVSGGDGSIDVVITRPTVRLVGADGNWRLPTWRTGLHNKTGRAPRVLRIQLGIRDATVLAPRPYGLSSGVNADLVANTGKVTHVQLGRMTWAKGPWQSRLEMLAAELTADKQNVTAHITELRTPDLELRADAAWPSADSVKHVHLAVGRVRWQWLAKVFDNRSFDVPGDGSFVMDATGAHAWRGRFRANLTWDGMPAEGTGIAAWHAPQLTVDSLQATTPAGDFAGGLRWSRAGWEVQGDARHANPAYWHAIHLDGWPAGDLNGRLRYAVETRGAPNGHLAADLVGSEWQGWRADDAVVRADFPPAAADSFSVFAHRRGGSFTLHGRTTPGGGWAGPYSVRDLPLEEWPDGRATGLSGKLDWAEGSIESRDKALFVTGDLAGSGTRWSAAKFAGWTLEDVRGRLLPTPDLTAQARATDGFFTGVHVDSAAAPITLGNQVVRFSPLVAQAGDTTLTMTGQASWNAQSWWMTLPSAEVQSSQFHFVAEPPVQLSGDARGVVFDRLAADDKGARVEAHGRWASPGGPYDFAFAGRHLDLARVGFPTEWGVGGIADVDLTVGGRSGDPRWRLEGRARAPAYGGHAADSIAVVLAGGAHHLELDDGRYWLAGGSLRASGAIERAPAAFPDSLSPGALVRWLKDADAWHARLNSDNLPVEKLASLVPQVEGWNGRVSGAVALSGSPSKPIADLDLHAEPFGYRDVHAERVDLKGRYADARFVVQDLRAHMQNVESNARITVPLQLALGATPSLPDQPVTGRIDIPAGDLQILPLLVPQIGSARGKFDLTADIGGTARAPRFQGRGHIRDGIVRPVNRTEIIEGLNADLHFDQSRIVLDTLTARQGRTGRIQSSGVVTLDRGRLKDYRLGLTMRDFAAAEEGLYAVLFDGDFTVSDGPRVAGQRLPQVTGQARIKKGVIEFDFASQNEVQRRAATTQPLYWTYHIQADATSNLKWRTQSPTASADIEFNADLDLQQTPDSLLIYGEMHALRGTYWFLSNRFKVLNADITFDNQQGVDPVLDVAAETQVRTPAAGLGPVTGTTSTVGSSQPLETLTAQITGRSSKPVITFTSSSNWDQRTILAALTYGRYVPDAQNPGALPGGAAGQFAFDVADNLFTRALSAQLSADLSRYFKGALTDWELQRDQGGLLSGSGSLILGVGSQVTDRLALRYQQRVLPGLDRGATTPFAGDLFEQNVEAEYRLNRFIFVTSGVSRKRNAPGTSGTQPTDYNLNLKARWEY